MFASLAAGWLCPLVFLLPSTCCCWGASAKGDDGGTTFMNNPELKHTDKFGNHKFDETQEYGEDLFIPKADRVTADTEKSVQNITLGQIKPNSALSPNKTGGKVSAQGTLKAIPDGDGLPPKGDTKVLAGSEAPKSYMLKGIRSFISPDVLHCLAEAGWQEEIVIADSTFPLAQFPDHKDKIRRLDGVSILPLVESIMDLLTLAKTEPLVFMKRDQGQQDLTNTLQTAFNIIAEAERECGRELSVTEAVLLNRKDFITRAKQSKVIVITGEPGPWNSLILRKGLVGDICDRSNGQPRVRSLAPGDPNPSEPPSGDDQPILTPLRLRNLVGGGDQEAMPAPLDGGAVNHSELDASQHAHNAADLNSALNILRGKNGDANGGVGAMPPRTAGILPEEAGDIMGKVSGGNTTKGTGPNNGKDGKGPGPQFNLLDGMTGKSKLPQGPGAVPLGESPPEKLPAMRVAQMKPGQSFRPQGSPSYRLPINPNYQYEDEAPAPGH